MRQRLEANEPKAWQEAVQLLKDRVAGRYLAHAHQLLARPQSGFAVLAIDCAVIEALEQFRRGVAKTPRKQSSAFFEAFLTNTRFKSSFSLKTAKLFYKTIRCGILHQAEAEATSLVKKKQAQFVVKLSPAGTGVIINSRRFHEELEAAFNEYTEALLHGGTDLRGRFITKMHYIARSPQSETGIV